MQQVRKQVFFHLLDCGHAILRGDGVRCPVDDLNSRSGLPVCKVMPVRHLAPRIANPP
jgi:hypothetical protein